MLFPQVKPTRTSNQINLDVPGKQTKSNQGKDKIAQQTVQPGNSSGSSNAPDTTHTSTRYADIVTYTGFLSELTDSMVEFLEKQPKSREGHRILQLCVELETEIGVHLALHPKDTPFMQKIKEALTGGDGTLELAPSGVS